MKEITEQFLVLIGDDMKWSIWILNHSKIVHITQQNFAVAE